jgi:hypothetical protein
MVRDVLKAAPAITLTSAGCDHGHDHGHDEECGALIDPHLDKSITDIKEGLKDARNPSGLVADCDDALKQIIAGLKQAGGAAEKAGGGEGPHNHLVAGVLTAMVVIAAAFIFFGARTDVVYGPEIGPDDRAFAYMGAVDAPNLSTWFAWAVLLLAVAGAVIWAMGRMNAAPRPAGGDNADLAELFRRGAISRDLYERGKWLAPDDALSRPKASRAYAKEYAQYVVALADTLKHRRCLETAAQLREPRPLDVLGGSLFGKPRREGH